MVYYKYRDVGTYHKWTRPFTLNAFSVELKQPLQIVAILQGRVVVIGGDFLSCGSGLRVSGWRHADRDTAAI